MTKKVTDIFINVANDAVGSQAAEGDVVRVRCTPESSVQTFSIFAVAPAPGNAYILLHLRLDGFDFIHFGSGVPSFKLAKANNANLTVDAHWKYKWSVVNE